VTVITAGAAWLPAVQPYKLEGEGIESRRFWEVWTVAWKGGYTPIHLHGVMLSYM